MSLNLRLCYTLSLPVPLPDLGCYGLKGFLSCHFFVRRVRVTKWLGKDGTTPEVRESQGGMARAPEATTGNYIETSQSR